MGAAIRAAQHYSLARGFDEKQTRQTIRAAVNSIADIHLYEGGELQQPQVLFLEREPPMSPTEAGDKLAWDAAISRQEPLLDELNRPLIERWSKLGSLPAKRHDDEWPQDEWPDFDPPKAKKPSRKPSRKTPA
jgi:hypothetical protein